MKNYTWGLMKFDGKYLIEQGFKPGPIFKDIMREVNDLEDLDHISIEDQIQDVLYRYKSELTKKEADLKARIIPLRDNALMQPIRFNIATQKEADQENLEKVSDRMWELNKTPTIEASCIMPDACPTGPHSVPVGAVIGARNAIHPGWHSADICCSMFASNFGKTDPKKLLDSIYYVTHFGPGGRQHTATFSLPPLLAYQLNFGKHFATKFFGDRKIQHLARSHFATQGDGNHFAFVGQSESNGDTWLITHHGSRGFGARLYKLGMQVAEEYRKEICPDLHKNDAWIPADTEDGEQYWQSLQIIREWTKCNHYALHYMTSQEVSAKIVEQRWNEHNFVFKEDDVYWHGKGATPIHDPFLPDTDGIQIIPLNMAEPILFVKGKRNKVNMGFAPHGAGRNVSRTAHKKTLTHLTTEEILAKEVPDLDVRFWCGTPDISELPSAYKDAHWIQEQMTKFDLATVVDRIKPYGTIMAGQRKKRRR